MPLTESGRLEGKLEGRDGPPVQRTPCRSPPPPALEPFFSQTRETTIALLNEKGVSPKSARNHLLPPCILQRQILSHLDIWTEWRERTTLPERGAHAHGRGRLEQQRPLFLSLQLPWHFSPLTVKGTYLCLFSDCPRGENWREHQLIRRYVARVASRPPSAPSSSTSPTSTSTSSSSSKPKPTKEPTHQSSQATRSIPSTTCCPRTSTSCVTSSSRPTPSTRHLSSARSSSGRHELDLSS